MNRLIVDSHNSPMLGLVNKTNSTSWITLLYVIWQKRERNLLIVRDDRNEKKCKRRIVQIEIIVFGTIFEKIIQLNNETSSKPVKIELTGQEEVVSMAYKKVMIRLQSSKLIIPCPYTSVMKNRTDHLA